MSPQHDLSSAQWCFYRQAIRDGRNPGSHDTNLGISFSHAIQDKVKATYTQLTMDELLKGCVDGLTQNANECFHFVVWCIFPKVSILILCYI